MRLARKISQGLFLLIFLFLFLQTESKGADDLGYPVKFFLDFDPLLFISTTLASRSFSAAFFLSLILLGATLLFGRFFCGWVCPLGTLNNMAGTLTRRPLSPVNQRWSKLKYFLLVGLLVASLFGLQLVGIFDPLSLTVRSLATGIYPAFNYAVQSAWDAFYKFDMKGLQAASDAVFGLLKKSVMAFSQPFFSQGALMSLLFVLILALNLLDRRFWCRYICPLGALLGLFSIRPLFRRTANERCDSCGACSRSCQGGADPGRKEEWKVTECFLCFNCDDICPKDAVGVGFSTKKIGAPLDLGRRRVLTAAISGAASAAFLAPNPFRKPGHPNPKLIRPPGSKPEPEFLERCIKCGECMKVCITNGLQPTFMEAGLEGIWSPVLVPRLGYCEYRCTLCGQVCPTGAIKRLTLEEKAKTVIGLAMIDKGRCLPFAHSTPCIVCEEVCPTPKKAIWFEDTTVKDRDGNDVAVRQPHVDLDLCVGCGICEAKCPVVGLPAIYVLSLGESRSKENQLLLDKSGYGPY